MLFLKVDAYKSAYPSLHNSIATFLQVYYIYY